MRKKLDIIEVGKALLRTVWYTVEISQCSKCHRKYPAFNFPVLNMWDSSYCRKCYNKIVAEPYYYLGFNPVRDFIRHLKWNWQNEVEITLLNIKYRKTEGQSTVGD